MIVVLFVSQSVSTQFVSLCVKIRTAPGCAAALRYQQRCNVKTKHTYAFLESSAVSDNCVCVFFFFRFCFENRKIAFDPRLTTASYQHATRHGLHIGNGNRRACGRAFPRMALRGQGGRGRGKSQWRRMPPITC